MASSLFTATTGHACSAALRPPISTRQPSGSSSALPSCGDIPKPTPRPSGRSFIAQRRPARLSVRSALWPKPSVAVMRSSSVLSGSSAPPSSFAVSGVSAVSAP